MFKACLDEGILELNEDLERRVVDMANQVGFVDFDNMTLAGLEQMALALTRLLEELWTYCSTQPPSLATSKVNFLLNPLEHFPDRIAFLRRRMNSHVINLLHILRSRIGFFFLFNFLDLAEMRERDRAHQRRQNEFF